MAKTHEAADAIKRMAQQYKHMVDAAALLDSIGNAEQHRDQLLAQAESAKADAEKAKKAKKTAEDALQATLDKNAAAIAEAQAQVKVMLVEARDTGDKVIMAAKVTANDLTASAEKQIAGLSKQMREMTDAAQKIVNELTAKSDAIGASMVAKQAELDKIETALAKAHQKIAALVS
jgi:DNA repair exonuclease SbcCD ATPase subunit